MVQRSWKRNEVRSPPPFSTPTPRPTPATPARVRGRDRPTPRGRGAAKSHVCERRPPVTVPRASMTPEDSQSLSALLQTLTTTGACCLGRCRRACLLFVQLFVCEVWNGFSFHYKGDSCDEPIRRVFPHGKSCSRSDSVGLAFTALLTFLMCTGSNVGNQKVTFSVAVTFKWCHRFLANCSLIYLSYFACNSRVPKNCMQSFRDVSMYDSSKLH